MCDKCLYNKNCQYLAKHKTHSVSGCTAFKSEADFKQEVAREIFEEIDGITDLFAKGLIGEFEMYDKLAELKKKYTEGEHDGTDGISS